MEAETPLVLSSEEPTPSAQAHPSGSQPVAREQEQRRISASQEDHLDSESENEAEITDSEDEGSTEGDGENGKVLSAERPPEPSTIDDGGVDKSPPPLTEYIINVIHFLDAILSNNSTEDHIREFISQGGMKPLLNLLSLPVLPLDFPSSTACNAITSACRSIMVS